MKSRRWFGIGLAVLASAGAVTVPALTGDSTAQAKDWHYEKGGVVLGWNGKQLVLSVGTKAGVYDGSTGMLYRGSSADFLTDAAGKKIRFEVVKVTEGTSLAKIIEGSFEPSMLVANKRVVLRAKNQPVASAPAGSTASSSTSIDSVPAASQLGQVCYPDGGSKAITPDAVLWMAKMIHGETSGQPTDADATSMLWAIAQRSDIWGFRTWDWQRFIQAYSQPINPIWTRTGSKCSKYYATSYTGEIPDRCAERRLAKREAYLKMSWKDVSPLARRMSIDFAAGKVANTVPGVVGWFDPGVWKNLEKSGGNAQEHRVLFATIDGNAYYRHSKKPNTTTWTATTIRVVGPGQACK